MNNNKYRFFPDKNTGHISDEDAKTYFSRIGIAVFVLGVAATLLSTLLYMLWGAVSPKLEMSNALNTAVQHIISFASIYLFAMPLFCYALNPLPTIRPYQEKMSGKDALGGFCVCLLGMMVGNYISNIIIIWFDTMLGSPTENPIADAIAPTDPATVAVTVIFMVIIGPILEEILFRKILCSKLLPLGEGYAIFLSAAIFGLFHGNFYQFAYAFLIGAVFALIYVKTGKLIYPIIYHMALNLLGSVVGPWILEQIDIERLYQMLEAGTLDPSDPIIKPLFLLMIYETVTMIAAAVGLVLLFKAKKRNAIVLEKGILPPPKTNRMANLFCNVGVAAAITYFVVTFFLSLL